MSGQRIVAWTLVTVLVTMTLTPRLAAQTAADVVQQPAAAPAAAPLTAAFVDRSGSKLGSLLESELLELPNVRWVERTEIKKILAEQALDRAFGSADIDARLKLGKLLTAEVLVLLREIPATGNLTTRYELAVCETRRGLRLGAKVYALPSDGMQQLQATMLVDIQRAFAKQREKITRLAAVSPLLNDSLTRRDDALQKALARLIEDSLAKVPGLLIVELQEARALANEKQLTNQAAIERPLLPYFLQGKFRFANDAADRRAVVELELQQGTTAVARAKSELLLASEMPAWLNTTCQKFVQELGLRKDAAPRDVATEIKQLNTRAREFARIQNWPEAITLADASLLLDPKQRDIHLMALYSYGSMTPERKSTKPADVQKYYMDNLAFYDLALGHFEQYLELGDSPVSQNKEFGQLAGTQFVHKFLNGKPADLPPEALQEIEAVTARRRETYWRILDSRLKRDLPDAGNACITFFWGLRTAERCELLTEMMERIARSGKFAKMDHHYFLGVQLSSKDPAVQAFFERSAKSEYPEIRQLVATARERWTPRPGSVPRPRLDENPDRPAGERINELELVTVAWPAKEAEAIGRPMFFQNRSMCIPLGDGRDLYAGEDRLLVMRTKGEFETLFNVPARLKSTKATDSIVEMSFDGKYVWVGSYEYATGVMRLFAIDLETKTPLEFAEAEGFVTSTRQAAEHSLAVAPLAPGKVVIAADIGRDWYGIGTIAADGKRSIEIIHEAKDRPTPTPKPEQTLTMALHPKQAYVLRPGPGSKALPKVLVYRGGDSVVSTPPCLVIDPQTKTVDVLAAPIKLRIDNRSWAALPLGERLWFETLEPDGTSAYSLKAVLSSLSLENLGKKTDHAVPYGTTFYATNQEEIHLAGNAYQIYSLKDKTLRTVATDVPWHYMDPYRSNPNIGATSRTKPNLAGVFYTNHYGFIVVTTTYGNSGNVKTYQQVRTKPAVKTEAVKSMEK